MCGLMWGEREEEGEKEGGGNKKKEKKQLKEEAQPQVIIGSSKIQKENTKIRISKIEDELESYKLNK